MKGFCGGVGTQTLDAGKGREKERKKERVVILRDGVAKGPGDGFFKSCRRLQQDVLSVLREREEVVIGAGSYFQGRRIGY